MANVNPTPPKWADRFLEWYCKPELLEAIQGDMWERFESFVEARGARRAKRWYILQVFLFINLYTLNMKHLLPKHLLNLALWQSYFKTGYRNALKNPWTSLINIIGLALATGCMLVVFVFMYTFFSNDEFHENLEEIYVVERVLQRESENILDGLSPMPLGPLLQSSFSQISKQTRYTSRSATIKQGEEVFSEWVTFADTSFPSIFSFPVKWGNMKHFSHPSDVILSEEVSQKYFGNKNPIGEQIHVTFEDLKQETSLSFTVRAVIKKRPPNASFGFNLLFPFSTLLLLPEEGLEDWQNKVHATFLQIQDPSQIAALESQMSPFIDLENEKNRGWPTQSYHLHPLDQISLHSNGVQNSFFVNSHLVGIILIIAISVIIFLQVCFNYINSAIALLSNRMQEISYRKVLGVKRKQIAFQFLIENLSICLIGIGIGTILAKIYFIPWFSALTTTDLSHFSFTHPYLLGFCLLLLIILVLGGSGYPAIYVSKLKPIAISHQGLHLKSNSFLRKSLLGAQFAFTFLAIFASIALFQHSTQIKNKSWGYNPSNKLVLQLPSGSQFQALSHAFESLPEVVSVSGSVNQIGKYASDITLQVAGQNRKISELIVGPEYLQQMGVTLKAGNFPESETGETSYILVNEAFDPQKKVVGTSVIMGTETYIISGVVRNFRQQAFDTPVKPMLFKFGKKEEFRYMTLFLSQGASPELIHKLKKTWYEILPFKSFEYFFQDDVFQNYFKAFDQINQLLSVTAGISILLSLMSLLGLLMLSLSQKMKEISIRKVLGAGTWEIGKLLNKEFFRPQIASLIIGAPLGFLLVKGILSAASPEFSTPNTLAFLYAMMGILIISFFSLYINLLKLKKANPIEFLRSE